MMLEREYAFILYFQPPGDNAQIQEIRVGHKHGTWMVARMLGKTVRDFFTFDDGDNVKTENGLLLGFIEAKVELCNLPVPTRQRSADIILSVLELWANGLAFLPSLVLKARRNSTVDEFTGEVFVEKS